MNKSINEKSNLSLSNAQSTSVDEKTLMENQISKIFNVIESADNPEITKIALDTLANKACENTSFLYMIFKNLAELVKKGNIKVIEDSKLLLGTIFDEFNPTYVNKLIESPIFRSQVENLILENENLNIFSINVNSTFESIQMIDHLQADILNKFNINQIESLYSNKSADDIGQGENSLTFNKMEMEILFPDKDEFREEVEECMKGGKSKEDYNRTSKQGRNVKTGKKNERIAHNKISVSALFNINTNKIDITKYMEDYIYDLQSHKKRKLDGETDNKDNIISELNYRLMLFNPMYTVIKELLRLNSDSSWRVRLCSITLLNYLQSFFDKILFSFYIIRVAFHYSCNRQINNMAESSSLEIDETQLVNIFPCPEELTDIIKENIICRLIINSVVDKVVDFNAEDYICIYKELNFKVATSLLFSEEGGQKKENLKDKDSNIRDLQLDRQIYYNILKLLEKYLDSYSEESNDWQSIYALLIFVKNILVHHKERHLNSQNQLKIKLFDLISRLMIIDSEEILNLTIQILDKMLEKGLIIHFIEVNKISEIFIHFLKLIHKYDDVEMGVKYYFNCLYNFILYFKSKHENEVFRQLIPIMEKEFIFFSLNKLVNVRIKYFEVLNNIFDFVFGEGSDSNIKNDFAFSDKFIENNIFLAYQGLCIEESKELLRLQKLFLEKTITYRNGRYLNIYFTNYKTFLKLLNYENLNAHNLNQFFIPSNEKYDKKELQMLYTAFFVNDMETERVKKNYEKKMAHIVPILAKVIQHRIDFTKLIIGYMQIELNPTHKCVLSKNLLTLLKIYFYYLEHIELSSNKVFILNDDLLRKLSDNNVINEFSTLMKKSEVENFLMYFKVFLDFVLKLSSTGSINNVSNETLSSYTAKLQLIYTTLHSKRTINTSELLDLLKTIFENIKNPKNETNYQNLCENFKCFTQQITNFDNTYALNLKTKIRGYASICLFIHSVYSNTKIEKVSTIANPILNFLKENSKESKIFVRYLIKLLYTVTNIETVNKILFSFLENSISIYFDSCLMKGPRLGLNMTAPTNPDSICENVSKSYLPVKYFFGEFAKFGKYNDIARIVSEYMSNVLSISGTALTFTRSSSIPIVTEKIPVANEIKVIILIFLLTFVKSETKCISFQEFYSFLQTREIENYYKSNTYLVNIMSRIFFTYDKIFKDGEVSENINIEGNAPIPGVSIDKVLSTIFSDINSNRFNHVKIEFMLKTLEHLFALGEAISQKFLLHSCNYLFEILKFINSKRQEIKIISINLFSKIMKMLGFLRMDNDYENMMKKSPPSNKDNVENNHIKSQVLMSTLLNQSSTKFTSQQALKLDLKEGLRSYQITGINWLSFLGSFGLGVALCDDMGLGKTIQTLVCIVNASKEYLEKYEKNPVNLIVCPNTLILNWVNESKKFLYEKDVKLTRIENSSEIKVKSSVSSVIDIYITSYDRMRDLDTSNIVELFYLVLDEAHIIKNPKTKLYQNIRKLSSERRVILTGTPIQNNVMELWALFDFLMPGFLGNENDFEVKFHKKIHSSIKKLNLEEKLQENIFQASLLDIRKRVKPFIMRRLKQDVLKELPDKIIQDYICEMTPIQKEVYTYWDKVYGGGDDTGEGDGSSKRKRKTSGTSERNNTLKVIDAMRKICNYPGLLVKDDNLMNIPQFKKYTKDTSILTNYCSSGKLKALEDLLISLNFLSDSNHDIESSSNAENKVLIFSQYKTMVDHILEFLKGTFPKLKCVKITADCTNQQRIDTVNAFNSDPTINVLILTTSIGGLGLSLTSANIVIMYDHDWNPMKDLQAMDRAHRLGQKKTVEVFRLITADSIEEKLISLQTFKKYIANNVVDQTEIHETNINMNNFMLSFEEFSQDKLKDHVNKRPANTRSKNKKSNSDLINEESNQHEEIELEYLRKLI